MGNLSLEQFQTKLTQSELKSKVEEILAYQVNTELRRQTKARVELDKLVGEASLQKIKVLRQTPDSTYSDAFEALICKLLDSYEASGFVFPEGVNRLAFCQKNVIQDLKASITDEEIMDYMARKSEVKLEKRLADLVNRGLVKTCDPEKAQLFAMIIFELEQRKTDDIWQGKVFKFEDVVARAINGETINFITMLCLVNKYADGNYTSVSDIFAYLKNPELKLKPVPEIIREIKSLTDLFKFYSINTNLTVYVADTDYTETGRYGPVTRDNLKNIQEYIKNLKIFTAGLSTEIKVIPFSEVCSESQTYALVKEKVLKNVTSFKDIDFEREWYSKFEEAVEKIAESQLKKKLYEKSEARKRSLEITRNIWACNAAEGAIFSKLGPNTIFISAEKRERDGNYVIDKTAKQNFPPVIYALQSTQSWYRATGK